MRRMGLVLSKDSCNGAMVIDRVSQQSQLLKSTKKLQRKFPMRDFSIQAGDMVTEVNGETKFNKMLVAMQLHPEVTMRLVRVQQDQPHGPARESGSGFLGSPGVLKKSCLRGSGGSQEAESRKLKVRFAAHNGQNEGSSSRHPQQERRASCADDVHQEPRGGYPEQKPKVRFAL
eukprot:CAMPEP_0178385528 /NCGR_PEP_ID=MMETSP0689_2-20121128/8077_1 /TAXON_ID=160604 /ORGANISM="Amphidinium massartii, Strain CS-259" /LENGTH=173 /DNA_ID=CAMNT_0020005809 /DNA_START=188 /DNA_END=709 /DNA_ORIENTATION=-